MIRRTRAADHPDVAELLQVYGEVAAREGRFDEAESSLRDALRIAQATRPPAELTIATLFGDLGAALALASKTDEARAFFQQSYEELRRLKGESSFLTREADRRLKAVSGAGDEPAK